MHHFPVQCLSIGRAVPAAIRERLAIPAESLAAALSVAGRAAGLQRLVILSTCHRIELYAELTPTQRASAHERLVDCLSLMQGTSSSEIKRVATYIEGAAAARHLHRVTAGLDSSLLGEAEIISQVTFAIQASVQRHAASPAIKALFRGAVQAAERARAHVWRRFRRADVGSVAVDAVVKHSGDLSGREVIVLGAGRVGRLAVRALLERGARVTVINRTAGRAEELAASMSVQWLPTEQLSDALARSTAVVVATGAAHAVLRATDITAGRALVVVDTAMPGNAERAIGAIPGVRLVELAALHLMMEDAHREREVAVPEVEALIEAHLGPLLERSWHATMTPRAMRGVSASESP